MDGMDVQEDVNTISWFLSHEEITDISAIDPVDCIVLCVSSVLHQAEVIFDALTARPHLTKVLVLCGGIGHSTRLVWEAVAQHPRFNTISDDVQGLPEAQVYHSIMKHFYPSLLSRSNGLTVLVEDRSTNCGANATETRKLLDAEVQVGLNEFIIVQDPTMVRRTIAGFEKVYSDQPSVHFRGCPVFVPVVKRNNNGELVYADTDIEAQNLWKLDRFLELIMGEVPRLRDDESGYGPRGKGFIRHVDIPNEVEKAFERLEKRLTHRREGVVTL